MTILIRHIKTLVHTESDPKLRYSGKEMSELKNLDNAYLVIEDDTIKAFGEEGIEAENFLKENPSAKIIDAKGKIVFPSWCDAHTHLVWAGSREKEFVDRIHGLSYQEIASRGGGILNSAAVLQKTSEEELFQSAFERIEELISLGTGAVEIKSGYGLTTEAELKMLRVINRLKEEVPVTVKSTFLGAHAIPHEYVNRKKEYVDLIVNEMIPAVASEGLADFIDIFCEQNYFDTSDASRIFEAGHLNGMIPKVHAEQLSHTGGIRIGVKCGAISVDHLEYINEEDIMLLMNSGTMPVILPGAQFFLSLPDPPVRKMIEAGLPVAICSDFNPGSCPSGNMNQMISIACIRYKMTPGEAIIAATTNSAYAMDISSTHGSIAKGKIANVFITKEIPDYTFLPYYFGYNLIETVILNGKIIKS